MIAAYYDVAVIGGGPAGLAAALSASAEGAKVLLVEREAKLGGILKQCIHDGFGLVRFGEKLSGPEYAHRFIVQVENKEENSNSQNLTQRRGGAEIAEEEKGGGAALLLNMSLPTSLNLCALRASASLRESSSQNGIRVAVQTFVTSIEKRESGFRLTLVNRDGLSRTECKSIVLACGCRERTSRQIGVHGRHCAGVFSAGTAQYFTNILGKLPTKRCVILGSGDIGLIMARRLRLEGAEVVGVYEAKPTPSGLTRNVYQCLEDFNIPLHTSKTVTRLFGDGRITAVEIADVDESMTPLPGTEQLIECDALILSVGLIPENELAESLGLSLDRRTNGPIADQYNMTDQPGIFCCGNALHVNDLVDYVSESGEAAGQAAARYDHTRTRDYANLEAGATILYAVPQKVALDGLDTPVTVYFRSKAEMGKTRLLVTADGREVYRKTYARLRPPEMERLTLDCSVMALKPGSTVCLNLEEAE